MSKRKAPTKVPKRPPRFLEPLADFVAKTHYTNNPRRSEAVYQAATNMTNVMDKYWGEYYEYVNANRPEKKAKKETPYSESKLNRDAQTILTKLEEIKANIENLDRKVLYDQMTEVCTRAQEVAKQVAEQATTLPTDLPIENTVAQTEPIDGLSNLATPLTTIQEERQ